MIMPRDSYFVSQIIADYSIANDIDCQNYMISEIGNHVNIYMKIGYFNQNV